MVNKESRRRGCAPVPIVCAIIERNEKFLIAQRGELQSHAGLWELPGGKVGPRETPRNALIREIREELDIQVRVHQRLGAVIHEYPLFTIELIPFVCSIQEGEPVAREHREIRWIGPGQVAEYSWTEADIGVLRAYINLRNAAAR